MLEVGDLVKYYGYPEYSGYGNETWRPKIALIIKVKKLLKLYDILIQTENVIVKDVDLYCLEKLC